MIAGRRRRRRRRKKEGKSFLVRPISFIALAQPGGHRRHTVYNGSAPLQSPDSFYFSWTVSSVTIYEREAKIASASLASQKVARRLHDGLISAAQLCRSRSLQEMRVNRFSRRSQSSRGNFCSDTWRISFVVVRYLSLLLEQNLRKHVLRKFHPFKVGPIITGGVVAVAVVVFSRLIAFLSPPILAVSQTDPPSPSAINT